MSEEAGLRRELVRMGRLLATRQLAHGTAGNLSARLGDGSILVTPTNSSLGNLDPDRISKVSRTGELISGDKPSKEYFFHLAVFDERPGARAVVHLHSAYSVAVSCLRHEQTDDVLPPLTAYYVMRVGKLPLVRYFPPGDRGLAEEVRRVSREHRSMLLANHGSIVSGASLSDAVSASEELEETAKISFILGGRPTSPLGAEQIAGLTRAFPA
ncbi:3-oxo-tetronate 4-phosphate decarboxylase [Amycolatopsis jiangsuensis]|uniref:3-oxo-tetronate 4-phosphate decarboxylase n=1 Tax=Amycolatopsis jiangsuensis TaxID=1181879 RepID=A0A840IQE2_9PSEU|nr:3-oxo-tetronate 4-phosphate decarboxylase [Amycolatopsis jiangsuensis]MBB4683398.1 ribulose-5-phosphate 4-epimerase/fuculose-1-phosphate aldolase [Amycolatopsis jiangsuensis]